MQWLWIFPGIGVVMLVIAGVLAVRAGNFKDSAATGVAVVTGYNESWSRNDNGSSSKMYQAVMELEGISNSDGSPITNTSSTSTSWRPYKVGTRVKVLYKPEEPGNFQIDSPGQLYFGPLICGAIGMCFLAIGIAVVMSMGGTGRSEVISEPAGVQAGQ